MTAKDIEKALEVKYQNALYTVPNVYFFEWEADFLVVQQSGIIIEIESKVTFADFKSDFKKIQKHNILSGQADGSSFHIINGIKIPAEVKTRRFPNKFYYACPEGLLKVEDIPFYAGLLYVSESGKITEVKKAPYLHKDKIEYSKRLITKFYYGYLESKKLKQDDIFIQFRKEIRIKDSRIEGDRKRIIELQNSNNSLLRELRELERTINNKTAPTN